MSFAYRRCADQDAAVRARHPVIVVGAGPVGLTLAIDLARGGVRTVLLDDDCQVATGSRAICFAKRSLEIWDRLGCAEPMVANGVSWNVGKVFFDDGLVYAFDLLPGTGQRRPAFINLPQYDVERLLCARAHALPALDVRWSSRVAGVASADDGVVLTIETPEGTYAAEAAYVVACDGPRSNVRRLMGLEARGQTFRDRFLIVDVRMAADFPAERWFWFDPPFHRGRSVLLHRQPGGLWRMDFQLGWDADPEHEKEPGRVRERVQALLGPAADFTCEWASVYTFACKRMERFRENRVLFAGDAAHCVSPFGARGANSGVQDADNLAWKLGLVLGGHAPDSLLDSYDSERVPAADENILHSRRSAEFITPTSEASRRFRNAALLLAREHGFARSLVNSGRLSTPSTLHASPLNTPDREAFAGTMAPGAPSADAPVTQGGVPGWFLEHVGDRFTAAYFAAPGAMPTDLQRALEQLAATAVPLDLVRVLAREDAPAAVPGRVGGGDATRGRAGLAPVRHRSLMDVEGLLAQRFDATPGTLYLFRPDQHVCARTRTPDGAWLRAALARACGHASSRA